MQKIIIFFSLFFIIFTVKGQDPNGLVLSRIIPPTPSSQEFQKFLGYPVGPATGTVDINIPLYNLQLNELDIPLTLRYHSSGIKVDQAWGNIGLGWTLFPAFKIVRTIMGKADEMYRTDLMSFSSGWDENIDYLSDIAPSAEGLIAGGDGTLRDGQYDIFNISLPNYNGSFILQRENGVLSKATCIPEAPLKITINQGTYNKISGFQVIDDMGVIYIFGSSSEYTEYTNAIETGWVLKQMIMPGTDNEVNFTYEQEGANYPVHFIQDVLQYDMHDVQGEPMAECPAIFPDIDETVENSLIQTPNFIGKRIKSMSFALGQIDFIYNSSIHTSFLSRIRVSNRNNQTIRTIDLTQNTDFLLTKVQISGKGEYKLEYDPQKFYTPGNNYPATYSQDRWGYYNGKNNRTMVL